MNADGLTIDNVSVRFGGLLAVDGLSLTAPRGRITALIGPNGAGKTTTFNACSGLVPLAGGRVLLDGRDVTALGPAARARLGLGRTFQRMELFESLTVADNVALGYEAALASANPWRQLVTGRQQRDEMRRRTKAAIVACGVEDLSVTPVRQLSTGHRRLVELARALAARFSVILLDEPSSGLDKAETARFAGVLRTAVEERDVGLLLVEHDMGLVMDVCDYIYVLDFGQLIFEGTPAEVRQSELVRAAYLGGDVTAGAAS